MLLLSKDGGATRARPDNGGKKVKIFFHTVAMHLYVLHETIRAVAARSEVVRLNSSVGLGARRKNARVAHCCRGVCGSTPRKILGFLAF